MHFSKPNTSDVNIFDETNASLIQSVIPKGLTVSISFESRLNDLLEITSQEYVMKHEETMNYYIEDPLDSPKDRIRKEINEIIFSRPDYIGTST